MLLFQKFDDALTLFVHSLSFELMNGCCFDTRAIAKLFHPLPANGI
jgi:hypothetical protein